MRDKIHDAVRNALTKANWKISADPFYLPLEGTTVEIDLEAEKVDTDSLKVKIIFVEIKSMTKTVLYDFYNAYGQYEFYRDSLKDKGINHPIYLAIPNKAFRKIEEIPALDKWVKKHKINLLIVDVNKEEIVQWIQY